MPHPTRDHTGKRIDDAATTPAVADLLTALQRALTALNTAPRFKVPSLATDSYAIAAEAERALAAARSERNPASGKC